MCLLIQPDGLKGHTSDFKHKKAKLFFFQLLVALSNIYDQTAAEYDRNTR